jgi:hypothetical protein
LEPEPVSTFIVEKKFTSLLAVELRIVRFVA